MEAGACKASFMSGRHKAPQRKVYDKRLGAVIRKTIQTKGINQKALALEVGIDASNLSRMLSGAQTIQPDQLDKIAKALGKSSKDLLPEEGGSPFALKAELEGTREDDPTTWPEGLDHFLGSHGERLGVTPRERWQMIHSRFRLEPWVKLNDDFWEDMLGFWRKRFAAEDAQRLSTSKR